jgi:uncharacterized protein
VVRAGALGLTALLAGAAVALDVPPLRARVTDQAGLLAPATARELDQTLARYERETGHQLALLVVPTLAGEALEDYALRVVESWKLGSTGSDDGLLLLIAVAERRARIEVGHGLEGAVTDALSARVLRDTLGPALAAGAPDRGVREALDVLMSAARQEVSGPAQRTSRMPLALFFLTWFGLAFAALAIERARLRALRGHDRWDRPARGGDRVWIEPAGWGGGFGFPGQRGGFGGGLGGGGFRGGGGSFGGGGASGRW